MAFAEQLARDRGCKGTWLVSGFGREEEAHAFYENSVTRRQAIGS